jgi:hypothetical protein
MCHFYIKFCSSEEALAAERSEKMPHANLLSNRLETVIEIERMMRKGKAMGPIKSNVLQLLKQHTRSNNALSAATREPSLCKYTNY